MRRETSERVAAVLCLAFIGVLFAFVVLRMLTREVLPRAGVSADALTQVVWFDRTEAGEQQEEIDWAELYPFPEGMENPDDPQRAHAGTPVVTAIEEFAGKVQAGLEDYSSKLLAFKQDFVNLAKGYESLIGWGEIGRMKQGILRFDDGHYYTAHGPVDTGKAANAVIGLDAFCQERGIGFVYVQIPFKVSPIEDPEVSGVTDFSAQSAAGIVANLDAAGVETHDVYEDIREEGLSHHELFFVTDHHWKPETGLWAAGNLMEHLRQLGYDVDPSLVDPSLFRADVYPHFFLGEYGRQVTMLQAEPDDISLLYPTYPTHLRFEIPSRDMAVEGDFSILYDLWMVEVFDPYYRHPYSAYLYGNRPLERIYNLDAENDLHVLILHDSYGTTLIPFLSMGIAHIDAIDLRVFNGSVESFIETEQPDLVIVAYGAIMAYHSAQTSSHDQVYDLR